MKSTVSVPSHKLNPSNRGQVRPGKLKVDWQSKELPALRAGSRELSGMLARPSNQLTRAY